MHKYWSKKPPNVVSHFINKFSKSGDVVLGAFCGSGVTICESVLLQEGKRLALISIQSLLKIVAHLQSTPWTLDLLKSEFHKIEVRSLSTYQSNCTVRVVRCAKSDSRPHHSCNLKRRRGVRIVVFL